MPNPLSPQSLQNCAPFSGHIRRLQIRHQVVPPEDRPANVGCHLAEDKDHEDPVVSKSYGCVEPDAIVVVPCDEESGGSVELGPNRLPH
eukprot:CAMPEP_0118639712 /NCGR_PEP_ID=MMETSP0785-20121206/4368_1 /TAXON_ID=91992 /ORGANISM="Bolidomonas pacifica, Strain CCMP 1866" /LENGTH=88 /DNA_ID=CAMNT_0006531055 /DNA_START=268 /DNA_END=534 /DNA_ORIENTATION=+